MTAATSGIEQKEKEIVRRRMVLREELGIDQHLASLNEVIKAMQEARKSAAALERQGSDGVTALTQIIGTMVAVREFALEQRELRVAADKKIAALQQQLDAALARTRKAKPEPAPVGPQ